MTRAALDEIGRNSLAWLMGSFNHQETSHEPPKMSGRLSCGGVYNSRADSFLDLIIVL